MVPEVDLFSRWPNPMRFSLCQRDSRRPTSDGPRSTCPMAEDSRTPTDHWVTAKAGRPTKHSRVGRNSVRVCLVSCGRGAPTRWAGGRWTSRGKAGARPRRGSRRCAVGWIPRPPSPARRASRRWREAAARGAGRERWGTQSRRSYTRSGPAFPGRGLSSPRPCWSLRRPGESAYGLRGHCPRCPVTDGVDCYSTEVIVDGHAVHMSTRVLRVGVLVTDQTRRWVTLWALQRTYPKPVSFWRVTPPTRWSVSVGEHSSLFTRSMLASREDKRGDKLTRSRRR